MDDNDTPSDSKKLLFQNFIVNVKETPQFGRMFSLFVCFHFPDSHCNSHISE
jgi:hypothetical protein